RSGNNQPGRESGTLVHAQAPCSRKNRATNRNDTVGGSSRGCSLRLGQAFGAEAVDDLDVERREILQRLTHGLGQQEVGKLGVAGEGWAVHVGGDDAALHGTLGVLLAFVVHHAGGTPGVAVAFAAGDAAEGFGVATEQGGTHVVLEAGEGVGEFGGEADAGGGGDDFTDGAFLEGDCGGVDKPEAVDDAAGGPEGIAEDLHARAHREDGTAGGGRGGQAAILREVFHGEDLGCVLAATQAVDVQAGG